MNRQVDRLLPGIRGYLASVIDSPGGQDVGFLAHLLGLPREEVDPAALREALLARGRKNSP
jgi:hypothetical protein